SIQDTLFEVFGPSQGPVQGLNWLVGQGGNPPTEADIQVSTDNSTFVNWSMHLHQDPTPYTGMQTAFDIGLPGLEMAFPTAAGSAQNTVDLVFGFDLIFNF